MTPAEAKTLRAMKGRAVEIAWRDPNHDWPYFRLLKVGPLADNCILLRGMDYPDGSAKHCGDEFWTDLGDVKDINLSTEGCNHG